MSNKELSNPFSTGSGGARFEANIQASFVTLMLTGGYAPCLPNCNIEEIKLQAKIAGYETDDLVVFTKSLVRDESKKLLAQVKHSISITESDSTFKEVIQAAWSDYNNSKLFTHGKDIIALITSPISKTNMDGVNKLLEQARHTKDSNEFITQIMVSNFSSTNLRNKLKAFKIQLKQANRNIDLTNDELHGFLKHFHLLGYDLNKSNGVVSALLQSHISQYNKEIPDKIWFQILKEVQDFNQNAGTIRIDTLSEDLIEYFKEPILKYIPRELVNIKKQEQEEIDWLSHPISTKVAIAMLAGSWNENKKHDIDIIEKLTSQNYDEWIKELREIIHLSDSPLVFKDSVWQFRDRKNNWDVFASRLFDDNINNFKELFLKVLKTKDPSFELLPQERFAAAIYGKVLPYSNNLRNGLAETLALMGNYSTSLTNCTKEKVNTVVYNCIKSLFDDADSVLWGSLDRLLPTISEASSEYFLESVDKALSLDPCPFISLFEDEESGPMGNNYMTGLLWALEGIAWEEKYLIRTSILLAELSLLDPGGNWANRPINSLEDIFLPWLPHTLASVDKRKVALKTICSEQSDIGWRLLEKLLPNFKSTTTGTYKPKWKDIIPENWEKGISNKDYWKQINFTSELLIDLAGHDLEKLASIAKLYNNLSLEAAKTYLEKLESQKFLKLSDDKKLPIWLNLEKLYLKHKKYSDSDWALEEDRLNDLKKTITLISSDSTTLKNKILFTENDYDLYDERGNWQEQAENLFKRRTDAILSILEEGGLDLVFEFMTDIEKVDLVGRALANIDKEEYDIKLLPNFLNNDSKKNSLFISSYINYKYYMHGMDWFDSLDKSKWNTEQTAFALSYLPFNKNTWDKVDSILLKDEKKYWINVIANFYQADKNLEVGIKKLLEFNRPYDAIEGFSIILLKKQEIDNELLSNALISLGECETELHGQLDSYNIVELIKHLQDNGSYNDQLFKIEWMFLPLLNNHSEGRPKILENKLSNDSQFFCELINLIYKPKHSDETLELSDKEKNIAENAYRLISTWKTIPGVDINGNFDATLFSTWIEDVEEKTKKSDHYEIAMQKVGENLINTPEDASGLFINMVVAGVLNKKDNVNIREGYSVGISNARGAYLVDYNKELELVKKYQEQAENIENAGFHRFAITLRNLAKKYELNAQRILEEKSS